jgi:hypothetical protein
LAHGTAGRGDTATGHAPKLTWIPHDPGAYCLRTSRAPPKRPSGAVALPDAVADGLDDGAETSVGVGTGGSVSVGNGDWVTGVPAAGSVVAGGALAWAALAGNGDGLDPGRGGLDEYWTAVTGWDVTARAGAAPISPAPTGALASGGTSAGVPSVQPTVTANGRPRATMPKKMDLGESRTPEHRFWAGKGYGPGRIRTAS